MQGSGKKNTLFAQLMLYTKPCIDLELLAKDLLNRSVINEYYLN